MKIVPEPDGLDARVPLGIFVVSLLSLLLGALLTLAVRSFADYHLHASAALNSRPRVAESAFPTLASGLFERHDAPPALRQTPQRLREYGWSDRDRGLLHIPIEQAKRLYLARQLRRTLPPSPAQAGSR